jgi:hypothetical protein
VLATTPTDENSAAKEKWNQTAISLKRHKTKHKTRITNWTTLLAFRRLLLRLYYNQYYYYYYDGVYYEGSWKKKNTYYQFHLNYDGSCQYSLSWRLTIAPCPNGWPAEYEL